MKLLIVEDHPTLNELLKSELSELGHVSDNVMTGAEALHFLSVSHYDAILLDLGLPDIDGMQLLKQIRSAKVINIPVIIVSARDSLESRVNALDCGADDYVTKPFDIPELEARLRTILRRTQDRTDDELCFGDLRFERRQRMLYSDNGSIALAKREAMLIEALLQSAPRIVIKDNLEENLYGLDETTSANAVEALVSRMRRKLKILKSNSKIETKRGIGYNLSYQDLAK